jgi:hypothetical protein
VGDGSHVLDSLSCIPAHGEQALRGCEVLLSSVRRESGVGVGLGA